jgi:hypothetical protein
MTYRGLVQNGVVVFEVKASLPEGTPRQCTIHREV